MNFYKSFGRSIEVLTFTTPVHAPGGGAVVSAEHHFQVRVGSLTFSGYTEALRQRAPADQCRPVVDFGPFNGYRLCVTVVRRWCAALAVEWLPGERFVEDLA